MPRLTKSEISKNELRDILISVGAVTFIFAYPNLGLIPFYFVAVVVAFLLHELAHRYVARRFGCIAVYKMWIQGILLGFFIALLGGGFKFVAPGAVMIYPFKFGRWGFRKIHLTMTEMGIIAVSGIVVNLFFAILFRPLEGILTMDGLDVFVSLSFVNAFLAFFNLLPIPPLDGRKVFGWKPWLWFLMILTSILLILSIYAII